MPYEQPPVSKLGIALLQLRTLLAVTARICTSPFKGSNGRPTYFTDVAFQALRSSLYHASLEQNRYLNPSTTKSYQAVCKKLKAEPSSITLPSGAEAHWITKNSSDKLIIYFHGGGYVSPAHPGQIEYCFEFARSINTNSSQASMVLLAYDCAPEYSYPHQLIQGVELIKHMIDVEGWDSSNILLGGDSAGGNLTLAVISHVLHPHPGVPPLHIAKPFHSAYLISPWVSFSTDWDSWKRNLERDMFYPETLQKWSAGFLGSPDKADNYSEPIRAPPEWWNGAEKVVQQTLVWGGEWEALIDSIKAFSNTFESSYRGKFTLLVTSRAAHEDMMLDMVLGIKQKGEAAKVLEDWVRAKL